MKSLSQRDYSAKEVMHHLLSLTADNHKLLIQCSAHKVERLS